MRVIPGRLGWRLRGTHTTAEAQAAGPVGTRIACHHVPACVFVSPCWQDTPPAGTEPTLLLATACILPHVRTSNFIQMCAQRVTPSYLFARLGPVARLRAYAL